MSKYCPSLETGLNFDTESISLCCPAYSPVPTIPYSGESFPLQKIIELRNGVRKQIIDGTSPCLYCYQLQEGIAHPSVYCFKAIAINNFRKCNAKCYYCPLWTDTWNSSHPQIYSVLSPLTVIFSNNLMDPDGYIDWGGGEPTILKEFEDVMDLIDNKVNCLVNTNGIRFSKSLAKRMQRGKTKIQISLDAGNENIFYKVKGVKKFLDVLSNIRKYATNTPHQIILKYIICEYNYNEASIRDFFKIVQENNITKVHLSVEANEVHKNQVKYEELEGAALFLRCAKNMSVSFQVSSIFKKEHLDTINRINSVNF